jgi:zinc protease
VILLFKLATLLCFVLVPLCSAVGEAKQAVSPTSQAASKAWGFDASDLKPHPGVRFGVLPNGMRYAIMRNQAPANSLSVRLRFEAGAMDEREGELGYLHLLEHLIFHGSESIPAGTLPLMLAHRGMKRLTDFGAVTSYDETVYRLDLSKSDRNARAAALMLMGEISSRLSFTRRSVAAAKKDVLAEIAARDAVRDRIATAQNAFFLPATRLARGPVVGSKASIKRASPDALRRLYQRHYNPSQATLVVVGDFDPAAMEAEIASSFGDWRGLGSEEPAAPFRAMPPARQTSRAFLFADKAAPTSVTISLVFPLHGPSDEAPLRDVQFLERIGNEMLNRRLARLAASPSAPFTSASAAIYNHFSTARIASLDVAARNRDWQAALEGAGVELRRALDHGFSQSELEEQLAITRTSIERGTAPQTSEALADAIVDAVGRGLIFTEAADPAATAAYLARVRLDQVNAAFNDAWGKAHHKLFVTHDRAFPAAETAIAAAWNTAFANARPRLEAMERPSKP